MIRMLNLNFLNLTDLLECESGISLEKSNMQITTEYIIVESDIYKLVISQLLYTID